MLCLLRAYTVSDLGMRPAGSFDVGQLNQVVIWIIAINAGQRSHSSCPLAGSQDDMHSLCLQLCSVCRTHLGLSLLTAQHAWSRVDAAVCGDREARG